MSLEYPKVPVHRILESAARRSPDHPAIVFQYGDLTTTYAELLERARRFAAALWRLGVRKGDVVAVQLPNSAECAAVYYGVLMCGAVYCPCNPLLSYGELLRQLNDSKAETLVTMDLFMDKVTPIRHDTALKRVIVSSIQEVLPPHTPVDVKPFGPKTFSLRQLMTEAPSDPPPVSIDPDRDLAHLAYTGGTTGVPKGVMLTHRAVLACTLQFAHWGSAGRPAVTEDGFLYPADLPEQDSGHAWEWPMVPGQNKVLVVVPWSHAMGVISYLNCFIYYGDTIVVHPRFDPPAYLADLVRHQVTCFGGAPQLFGALLAQPNVTTFDLSRVRLVTSGAAPLATTLIEQMERLMPDAVISEAYGLTEMTAGAVANPVNRSGLRKAGSVGIPVFDTDVKIVDLDDPDIEIGFDELGEVAITGPQMMSGYWNRPDETAKVMRNGWILTGDIGRLDRDGYLYIVDRKKDMLIYNGYNVYPRELEEILMSHRAVLNCAVIGKPDPAVGEFPKAFIVKRPDVPVTAEELMAFVATRVSPYKRVREVEFIDAIPMSFAGKPLKRDLREWELERMKQAQAASAESAATAEPADSSEQGNE